MLFFSFLSLHRGWNFPREWGEGSLSVTISKYNIDWRNYEDQDAEHNLKTSLSFQEHEGKINQEYTPSKHLVQKVEVSSDEHGNFIAFMKFNGSYEYDENKEVERSDKEEQVEGLEAFNYSEDSAKE